MIDLITFPDNNEKLALYTGVNIHGIYCCLDIIVSQTTLNTSCRDSHHFGTSSSTNNNTETLQPVIEDICV